MRISTIPVVCVAVVMAFASSTAMAQNKGGAPRVQTPPAAAKGDLLRTQDRLKDQDKLHDQDRLKDQDKLHDQDRLKDQDKLKDQDQDRLHDQDQLQDRDRLHDQDGQSIYGAELMTSAEVDAYMNQIRSLQTVQERNAFRNQHRIEMQQRARERGVSIPDDNGQGSQQQGSDNGN